MQFSNNLCNFNVFLYYYITLDFIPHFRYFNVYQAFLSWLYNFFSKPVPDWVRAQLDAKEAPTMLATNLKKWEQELIQQGGYV